MVNHNVRITFAVRITDGIASGIWASSVLSTYINVLEGDNDQANERVGYAQAIQGTFLAAAAIPAGWLAITHRRDSILKVMGLVTFAAIATTSAALVLDVQYKYGLLCCGLALWGVAQANAPVLDALFADSVPTGNRSKLYTWLHMSYIVAQGFGPGVGALMFALNGNVWTLEVLQHVMLVGMVLAMVPALLMLCFDDDKALGAESEGLLRVALLRAADEEEGQEEEKEGVARPPHNGPNLYGSYGGSQSQSPCSGDPDYRRPFLDAWCADTEYDYRQQVSGACSPARPVFQAIAAAGVGGGTGAAVAAPVNGSSHGYIPADAFRAASVGAIGGGEVGCGSSPGGASDGPCSTAVAEDVVDGTAAAAYALPYCTPLPPQIGSHALLLSPTTMSPATDRSGMTTPACNSPPPPGTGGDGSSGRIGNVMPGGMATSEAAVAASRGERHGDPQGHRANDGGNGRGSKKGMPLCGPVPGLTAAAVAERFHAVRQAVDGAAVAAAAAAASTEGPSGCRDTASSYDSCRSGAMMVLESRSVSEGGTSGSAFAAVSAAEAAAADGDDSAVSSSRVISLMAESLPSELSFNSLLGTFTGSFKSAHSRPFSRTGSSSSCGSARGSGGGSASAALVGFLPYLVEESGAEADVSSGPDTPTLDPQAQAPVNNHQPTTSYGATSQGASALPTLWPAPQGPYRPMDAAAATAADGAPSAAHNHAGCSSTTVGTLGSRDASEQWHDGEHVPSIVYGGGKSSLPSSQPRGAQSASAPKPTSARPHDAAYAVPVPATVPSPTGVVGTFNGRSAAGFAGSRREEEGVGGRWEGSRWVEPPPHLVTAASDHLDPRKHRFLCLNMTWIPGVLALTDCIMGLASGMTIKFFPIFFKDAVQLTPMYVNLMYCAIPLCLSAASFVAQRESRLLGRVQTMVLNRGIGISILYWIALHSNRWHDRRLMVPVYIARTSIMNSIYPLQKSILMDFVPKERRAAWNSLESVTSFGWSGSAALGGWLIHKFGFQTTFFITATMQCMGWAMSMLLLPIVPRKEAGLPAASRRATVAAAPTRRAANSPGGHNSSGHNNNNSVPGLASPSPSRRSRTAPRRASG